MECTTLREREREQKYKINEEKKGLKKRKQHLKEKTGEKCKKKKVGTKKIGQVRRKSLETFFWTK